MTDPESHQPDRTPHRVLAAILFTDAVSYSALAAEDESAALAALERDHALMRDLAGAHEGRVVKNTGDGLLMVFSSAAQAVYAALEMQRHLHRHDSRLRHRIGVHLGDVVISEGDAMGNGVNVAARIQQEAQPGSVCISKTVYDVVKGALPVRAVPLGPRALKNLPDPIPIYQLELDLPKAERDDPPRPRRGIAMLATVGVLAIVCVALFIQLRAKTGEVDALKSMPPGERLALLESEIRKAVEELGGEPMDAPRGDSPIILRQTPPPAAITPQVPEPGNIDLRRLVPDLQAGLGKAYDFDAIANLLDKLPAEAKIGEVRDQIARFRRLANLWAWFEAGLARTTAEAPLRVATAQGVIEYWLTGDHEICAREGTVVKTMSMDAIPASSCLGMMAVLVRTMPGATERRRRTDDIRLFAETYGLRTVAFERDEVG